MSARIDDLRSKREQARSAVDELLTRAASEQRDLSAEEVQAHGKATAEVREYDDAIEKALEDEVRELRAQETRRPVSTTVDSDSPVLTREQKVSDWVERRGLIQPTKDEPPSFDRYMRGIVTGRWDGADQERAMSEGTSSAGGYLVPTPLSARVIDLARNRMRVMQAGAQTVPMTAQTLKLAKLSGEGSPTWHTENASITASDLTLAVVTFTAQTLVRTIVLSQELFEDADPSADSVIANSFANQIAVELDRVALRGTGTAPQPRGVLNTSGITSTSHGANGTAIGPLGTGLGYDSLIDAVTAVRNNNFEPNAAIVAPRTVGSLGKLKEATTNAYAAPPPALDLVPFLPTNQVPINLTVGTSTDCSETYVGQWDQLMIGIRTDFNIQFVPQRFLADNLQVAFVAYLRADVQVAQPAAFAVDLGVRG